MDSDITIPIAMRSKDLNIFLLELLLKNRPKALARISAVLGDYNVNILSSIIDAPVDSKEAKMLSFIECSRVKAPLDLIIEKLKELDVVLDVKVIKPNTPGLVINDLLYPLSCLGVRIFCLHVTGWGALLKYLYDKFGASAKALLYYAGYGSIRGMVKGIKKITGLKDVRLLGACLQLFKASGFGDFKIIRFSLNPLNVIIRVHDLFECVTFKGMSKEPSSHMFRGMLAGVIEEIANRQVISLEEKCIAKGDPYCQFVVKPL